ncbi:MAG: tetratricopeptide repeat protein [Terriglobales bacterium]|jgi:protein O-mannosyl-transferase
MTSSSCAAAPKRVQQPVTGDPPHGFLSSQRSALLLSLLLIVAVQVSYNAVTRNGFINYDDERYIVNNPHIKAGWTWSTVKWAFTTFHEANWAPLSWLFHMLDYRLFGLSPGGHHYASVLLHAANAVLLFLLLQRATGFRWRSLMVAALFALHPINVESVAWAAELKNVLSMMFFLLALHAYVWYTRRPALYRYMAVFFLFALGLLSKSQVITFPFLLCLWDYWPLGRIFPSASSESRPQGGKPANLWYGWLVLEKLPLLLLSAASAVITMAAEKAGAAVESFARFGLSLRLETALIAYVGYLEKAFWPVNLVALYPHPTRLYPVWQVVGAAILLGSVTVGVLLARNRRYLAVGWFWFLGSLVPMIGLVQVGPQAMADRFAYLPLIGVFLMLIWLVADWAQAHNVPDRRLAIPAIACPLVLGVLTHIQVGYWHDIPTFWERTAQLTRNNYVAETNLGDYLFNAGRAEEAVVHFRAALAVRPDDPLVNMNLGAYDESHGNLSGAIARYQTVVLHTTDVDARSSAFASLGFAYRGIGQSTKARQCFEAAVSLVPNRTRAMVGLALLAQEKGDWAEAIRQYSHAVAVHPTDVTYLLLARALEHEHRLAEARIVSSRVENPAEAQKAAELFLSGK